MSVKKLGIVIYGICSYRNGFWEEWLDKSKELIYITGHTPTHADITGTSFPEQLRTLKRSEGKIKAVIANGEPVRALSVYSLPKDYHTCLDSDCCLILSSSCAQEQYKKYQNYAYCETNFDECNEELVNKIKNMLSGFIEMEQCEIFTMDKPEVPFNYVFKGMGDDTRKYPTLNILQQIFAKTDNSFIE
ncbi:MAG: hypothetical protein HFH68_14700 [Lachnospiraceae bacterium]|nr:hypothetical protein [Lachnospiraceae bacterium]